MQANLCHFTFRKGSGARAGRLTKSLHKAYKKKQKTIQIHGFCKVKNAVKYYQSQGEQITGLDEIENTVPHLCEVVSIDCAAEIFQKGAKRIMKRLKKVASILTVSTVVAASLAACGGSTSSSSAAQNSSSAQGSSSAEQTAALEGNVATGGSTSVEKVIGALGEAFMEENTGVTVGYDPTGSSAGVTGAEDGTLNIGLASRALKEEEIAKGLKETTFALDGIAIVVNNENTVEDLTLEQIAQLATGEITNWSEVGGPDAPVVLIGREAGSGTRDGFESVVDVEDACKYEQELTSTGAVKTAVAGNPNAFGYVSLASVDESVKAITVGGVEASEATVQDGTYKLQRPFVFVTKDGEEMSVQAQAFYDFALSEAAADLIRNAGAVPVV